MFYLIYISTAVDGITVGEIEDILVRSRDINGENGITGLLIFHKGSFIQMLEGSEGSVLETYGRIQQDKRHYRVTKMFSGPMDKRYFPDWKMAYQSVDQEFENKIKAYQPLEDGLAFVKENVKEHFALEMIHYFCELKMNADD